MSGFVPSKRNLREALLLCFHMRKRAAEAHRLLVEAYGEHAPSISTCEYWYRRFRSGNFDVGDKERPGQPRRYEDEKLKALLDEDPCRTQQELATSLGVTQQAVSLRLQAMGMVQKQGDSSRK